MIAVIDIETNLSWDTIWCAVVYEIGSDKYEVCTTAQQLTDCLRRGKYEALVGHNLIGFDVPRLQEVWGIDLTDHLIFDTLVLGRLLFPSVEGGHSLKAWCKRAGLAELKDEFDDFDGGYTEEMRDYCIQDCRANAGLYTWIRQQLTRYGFSDDSITLEHQVAFIVAQQERNGFQFDEPRAFAIHNEITDRLDEIEVDMRVTFPTITTQRWSEKTGKRLKDKVEVFNPGSRQMVARRLSELGAVWKEKTPTGHAKVSEDTLAELNMPEATLVLEYMTLQKKLGLVKAWLKAVGDDGRIRGRVITNGAVTGRMTHTSPNLAQVPGVVKDDDGLLWGKEAMYGTDCRACFTVPEGRKLVGCDASGLELRMLAHYMKDDDYTKEILDGDIHTTNQQAAGLPTRDAAKTFIYAFLYGAGDAKVGSITGGGSSEGAKLKKRFLSGLPSLGRLIKNIEAIVKTAKTTDYKREGITSVPGLDGRRVWIRHEHATLNSLLQSAGAIVMKKALVLADSELEHRRLDALFVANVHDEWQVDCAAHHAEEVGQVLQWAIREAGERLNMRCPLDGDYNVGTNWSETH